MTRPEVKLWVRLRELRALGLHFRRQSPVSGFIVDFECRRARLVVEIDGGQHAAEAHVARDFLRDERLKLAGYLVLRFWNHEVDRELEAVLDTIVRATNRSPTRPLPPSRGSGHPP